MPFYPITPIPCPRMTQRDKWKKRPVVMDYFAFRDEVKLRRVTIPIPCKVTFYLPMPQSWTEKKRLLMDGEPHTSSKADVDNLLKALLDSTFHNDGHVWSIWPEKRWSSNPGINIEPIDHA